VRGRRGFILGALALALAPQARAQASEGELLAQARRGGLIALMRHASTDGSGDLPGFSLEDCATQRNLSQLGRDEAHRIGERLRKEKVPIARVYTSPWCRCRDTAMLAFGKAEDWEPLGSVFDFPQREADYSERVRKRIATYGNAKPHANMVMVTHNVNIAAIARLSVHPGDIVLIRPEGCCGLRVLGTLQLWN
jgi:broad specificity phosphatase PhoE